MVTNLISGITGQFTRQWILGHFIPAVLFVIIGRALLVPMFPPDLSLLEPLESLGTEWQIVVIAFATILLTGLLFNLNNTISRLYQGYGWNDLWFGKLRVERYRKRFDVAHAQRRAMRTLRDDLRRSDGKEETIAWLDQRRSAIARRLDREYPARSQILPTRLGNVIRSNEYYPIRQYGMDGEALWPRMIGAMNKDYGAAVVDAKTSFDFTLNTSLLSGIMALSIFLLGLYYRFSLASLDLALRHSAEIVFFAGMSYVMYLMTIARAKEWGDMYRGAFDLYRGDLLKCLGYEQAPGTVTEEKRLWEPISRQLNFGYPPADRGQPVAYSFARTTAYGEPYQADLIVTRGASAVGDDGSMEITLGIKNPNELLTVRQVVISEAFPDGFDYLWDSARMGEHTVPVIGTNPYRFEVGDLEGNGYKSLTYRIVPTAAPNQELRVVNKA